MFTCCRGSSSVDEDEPTTGGGTRSSKPARGRRTFEPGSRILQTGRRVTVSELDLLKSKSAVTSTLRGLLKDSMGQVTDAAPLSRATRARAACHPCSLVSRWRSRACPHIPCTSQRYFLKFCHAEFSSENPEYWLAVQASARRTRQP